MTEEHIWE